MRFLRRTCILNEANMRNCDVNSPSASVSAVGWRGFGKRTYLCLSIWNTHYPCDIFNHLERRKCIIGGMSVWLRAHMDRYFSGAATWTCLGLCYGYCHSLTWRQHNLTSTSASVSCCKKWHTGIYLWRTSTELIYNVLPAVAHYQGLMVFIWKARNAIQEKCEWRQNDGASTFIALPADTFEQGFGIFVRKSQKRQNILQWREHDFRPLLWRPTCQDVWARLPDNCQKKPNTLKYIAMT